MEKQTYEVKISYSVEGTVIIEADTEDEARSLAFYEMVGPPSGCDFPSMEVISVTPSDA